MTACGQCQGLECSNAKEDYDLSDDGDENSEDDDIRNIFEELLLYIFKVTYGNSTVYTISGCQFSLVYFQWRI